MFENMISHQNCPGHILNEKTLLDKAFVFETKYCIICNYVEGTTWTNNER